jgi:hypothetical protein
MKCQHCQTNIPDHLVGPLCPACGNALGPITPPDAAGPLKAPRSYWLALWIAFLGGPALGILALKFRVTPGFLVFPLVGAVFSGYYLAKICKRVNLPFPAAVVIFTVCVLGIYTGIMFFGCLAVVLTSGIGR